MIKSTKLLILAVGFTLSVVSDLASQQLTTSTCNSGAANPPACKAVRGDRADGWLAQSRSEVVGRNGIVSTSQPLPAQVGLDILRKGGNAVDAAGGTAAWVHLIWPSEGGLGGELFSLLS